MGSAICTGQLDKVWIEKGHCPNCGKERYFIREVWEWYGLYDTCLKCGERYFEGESMERPFCPGWRKSNIDSAKRVYRREKKTINKDKKILVCDKCFQASCIQGIFYCDEYRDAGTTYKTVEELVALGKEHPSYWKDKDNG